MTSNYNAHAIDNLNSEAGILILNALIVTMDSGFQIIPSGGILIRQGRIADLGTAEDLQAKYTDIQKIDACGKLMLPGLINVHTHSPMTIFRGYADDLPLKTWLYDHIFPAEAAFVSAANVRIGTGLAVAEMIRSGTTTFSDMYFFIDEMARVADKAGMRAVLTESLADFPVPNSPDWKHSLSITRDLIKEWKTHPRVNIGVSVHAPYSASPEIYQAARDLALEHNLVFHTHVAETRWEYNRIMKERGLSPVQYLESINVLVPNLVAAHSVHLDEADIELFARRGVGVAHNAQCNMKMASGTAPISRMIKAGIEVGIGTDGVASNNDLDLLDEMRTASFLQKLSEMDPTAFDARRVLEAATMGGARLLGMDKKIGSLEVGKQADLILLDMNQPHAHPVYNIYSLIVYSMRGSDVDSVMVDGQWLMRGRKLLSLDEPALFSQVEEVAGKIRSESAIYEAAGLRPGCR